MWFYMIQYFKRVVSFVTIHVPTQKGLDTNFFVNAMFTPKALGHGSYMTTVLGFLDETIKKFMDYII